MFKKSNNPKVEELNKSITDRSYKLDSLKPIKLEELNEKGKPKRLCAWCVEIELNDYRKKYCSVNCSQCAMAWGYPQKEDGLRFLLIRQEWKCAGCNYDYKPFMEAIVDRDKQRYKGTSFTFDNLPWHYFKRLKSRVPKEYKPEVDHIIPIYKGGQSLGLDNHWCLCYSCHKTKTKVDLSGKRG